MTDEINYDDYFLEINFCQTGQHFEKLKQEAERIRKILEEFVEPRKTRDISNQLLDWAVELDQIVSKLTLDEHVSKKYDYDGWFFTHKSKKPGFHRCPDGLHFLQSLKHGNLKISKKREQEDIAYLLQYLKEQNLGMGQFRLACLKNYGSIDLVRKETLKILLAGEQD